MNARAIYHFQITKPAFSWLFLFYTMKKETNPIERTQMFWASILDKLLTIKGKRDGCPDRPFPNNLY